MILIAAELAAAMQTGAQFPRDAQAHVRQSDVLDIARGHPGINLLLLHLGDRYACPPDTLYQFMLT